MSKKTDLFPRISLFTKHHETPDQADVAATLERVIHLLEKRGHQLSIEENSAKLLNKTSIQIVHESELANQCDLVIVVGGDGSLLKAARCVVDKELPIVGINRGRLGFLTDINPHELEEKLIPILDGHYVAEKRSLLHAIIKRAGNVISENPSLNDIVLYSAGLARMIEYEVAINNQFVFRQRGDGLIVATPTGSTAYALSGGGPILYPTLKAFALVPMFAHTLTSRPIVVDEDSVIELTVIEHPPSTSKLSIDGQLDFALLPGDKITIQKHPAILHLLHPLEHNYFAVLRQKLGWSTNFSSDRWANSQDDKAC